MVECGYFAEVDGDSDAGVATIVDMDVEVGDAICADLQPAPNYPFEIIYSRIEDSIELCSDFLGNMFDLDDRTCFMFQAVEND